MDDSQIIAQLSIIITELEARECSNNCPTCMRVFSWEQLCDMGIDLFEQLKRTKE